MFALCGLVLMSTATASPPATRLEARHLDLRAPAAPVVTAKMESENFSARRQSSAGQDQVQFAGLTTMSPPARTMGRTEEFALRVHREGLPVARLWETKSALVSLGLNQKGKPGLWLTQKVH